jgi:hypothetical protein
MTPFPGGAPNRERRFGAFDNPLPFVYHFSEKDFDTIFGWIDMGKLAALSVVLVAVGFSANAQFKSQVEEQARVSDAFVHDTPQSLLFGWFNPDRFHMSHSLSFSYVSFAGGGLSLGTYTNSMRYDVMDNLTARADVSLSYSPYNSFTTFGKNDLSSIYLSRAELDYRPWENMLVKVQYRTLPYGYYSPFYSPWYRDVGY